MSENKVTFSLGTVLRLTTPPGSVLSVADYRQYITDLLMGSAPGNSPGRPLKASHPSYTDAELKSIKTYLMEEVKQDPEAWKNAEGRLPTGLNDIQVADETIIHLNNGVAACFSGRIAFEDGVASPLFPPSVDGP